MDWREEGEWRVRGRCIIGTCKVPLLGGWDWWDEGEWRERESVQSAACKVPLLVGVIGGRGLNGGSGSVIIGTCKVPLLGGDWWDEGEWRERGRDHRHLEGADPGVMACG